jgi:hypothetical protein
MRMCKCGGVISQSELTKNRTAWRCMGCGRYEVRSPVSGNFESVLTTGESDGYRRRDGKDGREEDI